MADAYSSSVSSPFACRSASDARRGVTSAAAGGASAALPPPTPRAASSHQLDIRARVSATTVEPPASGNSRERLPARQLDPRRAERGEDGDDEEAGEVDHLSGEQHQQHEDREHDVRPDAIVQCRREPAARRERAPPGAGEPRRDEEEDPDDDHQPERAAHELGEDVPGVVRRLAVVARATSESTT